ncbi:MAG: sterol desaturase family protein [Pseudomonadota bacterium]
MSTLLYLTIPAFVLAILVEWSVARKHAGLYEARDTVANLTMGTGNVLISAVWKLAMVPLFAFVYQYRLFDLPQAGIAVWFAAFVVEDLCYYAFHRYHHTTRIGWAAHVNHHSSEHYNLAVALRQSWTTPFTGFWFWLPMPLLGFHPLMVLMLQSTSLIYQFWIHTQFIGRLGPFEWVFNTPSHHRVHHGSNPEYIDRNFGGVLIIWDRLFGTFEPEKAPVTYGLTKNIHSFNPITIAFHEWRGLLHSLRELRGVGPRLREAFRAPNPPH